MDSSYSKCVRCHRALSDPISRKIGMGPVCRNKVGFSPMSDMFSKTEVLLDPFDSAGLVCRREIGEAVSNIPQKHKHHSPTGIEWGYAGSGPADLSLNVMARVFPLRKGERGERLSDNTHVSSLAWSLHQDFKFRFIATMPREGGRVPIETIRQWLVERGVIS